jgi:hypothetical protein
VHRALVIQEERRLLTGWVVWRMLIFSVLSHPVLHSLEHPVRIRATRARVVGSALAVVAALRNLRAVGTAKSKGKTAKAAKKRRATVATTKTLRGSSVPSLFRAGVQTSEPGATSLVWTYAVRRDPRVEVVKGGQLA